MKTGRRGPGFDTGTPAVRDRGLQRNATGKPSDQDQERIEAGTGARLTDHGRLDTNENEGTAITIVHVATDDLLPLQTKRRHAGNNLHMTSTGLHVRIKLTAIESTERSGPLGLEGRNNIRMRTPKPPTRWRILSDHYLRQRSPFEAAAAAKELVRPPWTVDFLTTTIPKQISSWVRTRRTMTGTRRLRP
jgi:hypothetical protein